MRTFSTSLAVLLTCGIAGGCGDDTESADTDVGTSTGEPGSTGEPLPGSTGNAETTSDIPGGSTGDTPGTTGVAETGSTGSAETTGAEQTAPTIELLSPRPGSAVASRVWTFEGTADDVDGDLDTVTYDGPDGAVEVEVADDGSFSAEVTLVPGPNSYAFTATDAEGNTAEATLDVHFGHRISVGNSQAAYLRDGTLFTWGRNELGQLGNGTLEGSGWGDDPETANLPVRYEVDVDGLVSVVNRQTFMLGLHSDGTVLSWGSNGSGQLGRDADTDCGSSGTSACGRTPTVVPGVTGAVAIGAGFEHALVLREDGSVWAWGDNAYGQLGDPAAGDTRMSPAAVVGVSDIIQVAAGSDASYALTADGTVYAWGENDRGQLGRGTTDGDAHPTPTLIDGLDDVVHVAAANTTAFALRSDGSLVAWGRNHTGQAGIGVESGDNVLMPTPVVDTDGNPLGDVVSVAGDGFVGLALTADGTVYAWGLGALGQLGQGYLDGGERDLDARRAASPVAIDDDLADAFDPLEIEGGAGGPSLALSADGNLFGWGWSFQGSLGLEGAINAWAYSAPVVVFAAD